MTRYPIRVVRTALVICATLPAMASGVLWDPETALTVPPVPSAVTWAALQRKLVVTDNGERHLVYHKPSVPSDTPQVYYKRFVPGSGWLPETCISRGPGSSYYNSSPAIGLDSVGNLHVVWTDGGGYFVYYRMRDSAGVWNSVATRLSSENGAYSRSYPGIACTPDGHAHVVWLESHRMEGAWLVYREKVGDVWGPACIVESVGVDTTRFPDLTFPCIAAGPDNSVHLTYTGQALPGGPPGQRQIYYRRRSGGVWGSRERVSLGNDDARQGVSAIAVYPHSGEPHVVWTGQRPDTTTTGVWHSQRTGNGWLPPQFISDSLRRANHISPSLVFTRDGIGHVTWLSYWETAFVTDIMYTKRNPSGWWQPPVVLTRDSVLRIYAGLADGGSGPDSNHIHLVWTDPRDGPDEVYYRHGAPSPQGIQWGEEMPLAAMPTPTLIVSGTGGLTYTVERAGPVRLVVFDAAGRLVRNLVNSRQRAGSYTVVWDGTDNHNREVADGIYFYRLDGPGISETRKAVLIKR